MSHEGQWFEGGWLVEFSHLGRKVVVDDAVEEGNVDAAGGHISDKQHHALLGAKLGHVDLAGCLVETAVAVGVVNAHCIKQRVQILDVVLGGHKHNRLLRLAHSRLQQVAQHCRLVLPSHIVVFCPG